MNFGKKFCQNLSEAPNGLSSKLSSMAWGLEERSWVLLQKQPRTSILGTFLGMPRCRNALPHHPLGGSDSF